MIETTWANIKAIKASNNNLLFYSEENMYSSNDPNITDINRYYIRMQDGIEEYYTFICIEDPRCGDQIDFEDNYKSSAIET